MFNLKLAWSFLNVLLLACLVSGFCHERQYEFNGECKFCPEGCLECTSESNCVRCLPKKALYNNQCLDSCPMHSFRKTNQTLGFAQCLDPDIAISYTQSSLIFPFGEIRNYSERTPDLLYIDREGSEGNGYFSGWVWLSGESLENKGVLLEVYDSRSELLFIISIWKTSVYLQESEHWSNAVLNSWNYFSIQLYPFIHFEIGSAKRQSYFEVKSKLGFFIVLGNQSNSFPAAFRGTTWYYSTNSYGYDLMPVIYGLEKFLATFAYFPQGAINESSVYNLTFPVEENIYTLRFKYRFIKVSNKAALGSCKLFEVLDPNGAQYLRMEIMPRLEMFLICKSNKECFSELCFSDDKDVLFVFYIEKKKPNNEIFVFN